MMQDSSYLGSIFPKISYEYIIDIQFNLGYYFHCNPFEFDSVELFEFLNMWERLAKKKEQEAKEKSGNQSTSLESLLGGS
jgi:hypothetical protein